jgi:site-specific DNA-cytosine methylase
MRQLGNAVPVLLAEVVAKSVAKSLLKCEKESRIKVQGRA